MKLELKHLVHYLPYGLKAKLSQEGVFNLDAEYRNEQAYSICTITDFTTYSKDLGGSMKVDNTKDYSFDFDSLSEIEIILRPLSDLATFIIHNEVEFYPLEWIAQELDCDLYSLEYYREHTLRIPYEILSKLLEWHFDIFGLIEKGLAVDINTLNK